MEIRDVFRNPIPFQLPYLLTVFCFQIGKAQIVSRDGTLLLHNWLAGWGVSWIFTSYNDLAALLAMVYDEVIIHVFFNHNFYKRNLWVITF